MTSQELGKINRIVTNLSRYTDELSKLYEGTIDAEELNEILLPSCPFTYCFNEVSIDAHNWLTSVRHKIIIAETATTLINSKGETVRMLPHAIAALKDAIARNETADQIQDMNDNHQIIVFASNPILFKKS